MLSGTYIWWSVAFFKESLKKLPSCSISSSLTVICKQIEMEQTKFKLTTQNVSIVCGRERQSRKTVYLMNKTYINNLKYMFLEKY
jgi:hypothetical protein